jgi:hypothetical protein
MVQLGRLRECIADLSSNSTEAGDVKDNGIERLVRDAIIGYQEMYANAPNDDVERELIERAKLGNAWLVANGYNPEPTCFSKEEIPYL